MKADIICVGTGYMTGMIPEKNSAFLAGRMAELDVNVRRIVIIGEDDNEIRCVLEDALRSVDTVVIAGGTGYGRGQDPFAEVFEKKLVFSEKAFEHIKTQAEKSGVHVDDEKLKPLAMFPCDAMILDNYAGYVPGYILEKDDRSMIVLPAGENDLQSVFEDDVVGYIFNKTSLGKYAMKIILNENAEKEGIFKIIDRLGDLAGNENPNLNIVKDNGNYVVKVNAAGPTEGDAMILANIFVSDCCSRIGKVYIKDIKEG